MSNIDSVSQSHAVRTKRTDGFLMLLLVTSLCLNVYLGWQVKLSKKGSPPQKIAELSPGMKVNTFTAVNLQGVHLTISYDDTNKPTVFYVISPGCIWCKRNQANIDKLADTKGNDFRFIGLSLTDSGLREYIGEHPLKFPIYTGLTSETITSLGLGSTPHTIVISPQGEVLKSWTGAYIENLQPDVEAYFGVQLPGLTSVNKGAQ